MAGPARLHGVGAHPHRGGRDPVAGPPAPPGRPPRADRAVRQQRPAGGGAERRHRRGRAGRPPARHPVGWLLLALGASRTAHDLTYAYTRHGLVARPGALPGAAYLAGLNNGLVVQWIACAGFVLLLTPTGRLPSPRWRWWARSVAAAAPLWLLGSVISPAPLAPEYPE